MKGAKEQRPLRRSLGSVGFCGGDGEKEQPCPHFGWAQGQRGTLQFRVNVCTKAQPTRLVHFTQPKYKEPDLAKPEPRIPIPEWCPLPAVRAKE